LLSHASLNSQAEAEQLKRSIIKLESERQKILLENEQLQRVIEDDRIVHEKANAEVQNQLPALIGERTEIEASLRRANETIEELEQRCCEVSHICQERQEKCLALSQKIDGLESTSGRAELKEQLVALQKAYDHTRRLNSALSSENESYRERQELIFEIGRTLADAIGDVFVGRQPIHEVRQLIEKVRNEHGRTLLLEKLRREAQPPPVSLPRIDELDREIRTLQRVIGRPPAPP
jgi:chromosome segregation ATPase